MKVGKKTTVRIGAASRRIIPKKIRTWLAPSIRADSSISTGMVSKKPFIRYVFTPREPPRYTRIRPQIVPSPSEGKTSRISESSRKIAVMARIGGNIWIRTRAR